MAAEDLLLPDAIEPPAPAVAPPAPPSDEDLLGPPSTQQTGDSLASLYRASKLGLGRRVAGVLNTAAGLGGNPVASDILAPVSKEGLNARPGAGYIDPNNPLVPAAEAAGGVAPDIAAMLVPGAQGAVLPGLIGERLAAGPREAEEMNASIRQAKAAFPDDPKVQALQEVDPAAHGLVEAAKVAAFVKLAPMMSEAGLAIPMKWAAGQVGPIGATARAVQGPIASAGVKTAANTVGNLAIGDVLERATNPNYEPPKTPAEALAQLPAAAGFGAVAALHGAHPPVETPDFAKLGDRKYGGLEPPPVAPPAEQPTPAQAAAAVPSPVELNPELTLSPLTAATTSAAKAAAPKPEAPKVEQPATPIAEAPPTTAPAQPQVSPAETLFPTPEAAPQETQRQRLTRLDAELAQTDPAAHDKIQALAERREWGETEVLEALEKAVADARLKEGQPPTEPKPDEQKGSTQTQDERRDVEQQTASEPDAVDQVRQQQGNAVADEGAGDQVRGRSLDGLQSEERPVQGEQQDRGVSTQPDAGGEGRGNGEQRPSTQEQPLLGSAEEQLAPRPGSLGTPEGQRAVRTEEAPKGKAPKKTIEEHEEDLHELNPEALADLQRERTVNAWSDRTYERAVKGRVAKELKSQGQEEPPAKVEKPAAPKKGPKKQTDAEKVASIKQTIKDLESKAKVAAERGDHQAAAQHLSEAKDWQEVIDANKKAETKAADALRANEGEGPVKKPKEEMENADTVTREVNAFKAQFPEAPEMVPIHSSNLQHALDPDTFAAFQKFDKENGGRTRAFTDVRTGKTYLLHDRWSGLSPFERRMIYHEETFGHNGIEGSLRDPNDKHAFQRTLDDAFDAMVAEQGPLAKKFADLVRTYKGRGVDPHELVNDDTARREIMAELLAHEAGKYVDRAWVQKAWTSLKGLVGRAVGMDLTAHDDMMQRLVDAGRKHLKEQMSEGWETRDYTPGQRAEIRANLAADRETADTFDKSLPFKRPPSTSINDNERFISARPEDWAADAALDALRSRNASTSASLPDGDLDPRQLNRQLNAAFARFKSLGREINYDDLGGLKDFVKGGEHYAKYDPASDRYLKFNIPGKVGFKLMAYPDGGLHLAKSDLKDYAQNRKDWNEYMGDDVRIHGMMKFRGHPVLVTSQPNAHEIPPPDMATDPIGYHAWAAGMERKIDDYFQQKGFVKVGVDGPNGATYVNPDTHVLIADMKPANMVEQVRQDGSIGLRAIDGALARGEDNPAVKRALEMAEEIKRGERFPNDPTKPKEDLSPALPGEQTGVTQQLSPAEAAARAAQRLKNAGVVDPNDPKNIMAQGGLESRTPITPSEQARMGGNTSDYLDSLIRANVAPEVEAKIDKDNQLSYTRLDERLFPSANQARVQGGAPEEPGRGAADYILRRDAERTASNRGIPGTFPERYRDQTRDLVDWAKSNGRVLDPGVLNLPWEGGGEHRVWFDEATQRWLKVTDQGQLGLRLRGEVPKGGESKQETGNQLDNMTTPLDYLDRVRMQNELGDDVKVHGITYWPGSNHPSIVTSQPHYDGVGTLPNTVAKIVIDRGMTKAGFTKIGDGEFYNPETRMTIADAFPRNVAINKDGSIVPFDIVTSRGDRNVEQNSREAMARVQSGQTSFKTDAVRDFFDRGRPQPLGEPMLRANVAPENRKARTDRLIDEMLNADNHEEMMDRAKRLGMPTPAHDRVLQQFYRANDRFNEGRGEPPDEHAWQEKLTYAMEADANRFQKANPQGAPMTSGNLAEQRRLEQQGRDMQNFRANVAPLEQAHEKYKRMADIIARRFDEDVQKIRAALPRGLDARDNEAANAGLRAENDVAAFVATNGGDKAKNSPKAIAERESILPLVEAGFGRVTTPEEYAAAVDKLQSFKDRVDATLAEPRPANAADVDAWEKRQAAAKRLEKPTNDALDIARNDSEKATGWAGKVKAEFDEQHGSRQAAGLKAPYFDDYVKRLIEADGKDDTAYSLAGGGGAAGFDRSHNLARRFESAYDAMEQGKKLAAMDVAGLVGGGQVDTMKAVGNEDLFDQFRYAKVPGTGRAVIADGRKVWNPLLNNGEGGFENKAPKGPYVQVTGPRGERLWVDKEFAPYFQNLLAPSYVRGNTFFSGLLHTAADLKHGVLLFDTFHVGRVMARLANLLAQSKYGTGLKNLDIPLELLHQVGIGDSAKYGKGRAALDFRPETLQAAEDLGWIGPKERKWAEENQRFIPLMEKTGFNVAGNLDNLYERAGHGMLNQALHHLGTEKVNVGKGIETFNKWVFQKLTRNAMTIGWREAFDRNTARFPGKSEMDVARITSKEMNEYFGNLGRQGLFKTATAQDFARLAFLAPQWANSMIASQARGIGQFADAGGKLLHGESPKLGNVAGAMGAGYLGMLAANQIINLITKHQPTWDNEEGHKTEAYIPGGAHGFYMNPASIVAEELHTLLRYHEGGTGLAKSAARIVANKASPFMRAQMALNPLIARDSMLRPIKPGTELGTAARALNPLPIFSGAATGSLTNPEMAQKGDAQRQLFGMAGIKLDRAPGPGQKLRNMARTAIPDAFPKDESPGDYAPLRAYVNNDNESKAKSEILDLLRKGKTIAELNKVFTPKPVGGSAQRQALFLQRKPDAVSLLEPAARETGESAQKLATLIQSIPPQDLQEAISKGVEAKLK